jgi:hypothetical protein
MNCARCSNRVGRGKDLTAKTEDGELREDRRTISINEEVRRVVTC